LSAHLFDLKIKQHQPVPVVFWGGREKNAPCISGLDCDKVPFIRPFVNIFKILEASIFYHSSQVIFIFACSSHVSKSFYRDLKVAQLLCYITEVEKLR